MKRLLFTIIMMIFLSLLTGCVSRIVKPNTPFERPTYTVYSPQSEGWLFFEGDQPGEHRLFFGFGSPQKSKTYTLFASVAEISSDANFNSPQEFESFIQKKDQIGFDHRRFKIVQQELNLDNKFGDYSVLHYSLVEDHGAYQFSDAPYLLTKTLCYYFIHPYHNKQIISVIYSERGKESELDERFREKAQVFFNGLNLKK